jgi:hypothetical protein
MAGFGISGVENPSATRELVTGLTILNLFSGSF